MDFVESIFILEFHEFLFGACGNLRKRDMKPVYAHFTPQKFQGLFQKFRLNSFFFPGSLPSILRRCMVERFHDFDEYQLGKHGKKVKKGEIDIGVAPDVNEDEEMMDQDYLLAKKRFSVKRLIRLLHIKEPVLHVMGILGKK